MSWSRVRLAALAGAAVALAGCGFEPLYGTRAQGNVVREFAYIHISPIKDRVGQQLRNELLRRLHATGRSQVAKYTLSTKLKESTTSLAVRKSAFSTRANLTMTAAYRLVDAASSEQIYSASDTVTVSYNILDSEFATLMAERDARERAVRSLSEDIRIRLGVYFERPAETRETR